MKKNATNAVKNNVNANLLKHFNEAFNEPLT